MNPKHTNGNEGLGSNPNKVQIEVRTPKLPQALLEKLPTLKLEYATPKTVFHFVSLWDDLFCGVFGDGDNGAYEWFEYDAKNKKLETSNVGFGHVSYALEEVMKRNTQTQDDHRTKTKIHIW